MNGKKIGTSTAIEKLMITILDDIAEVEADMVIKSQFEGIVMAKNHGVYKGRLNYFAEKYKEL
ncbi:hypothetical protein ACQVWA_25100 [Bacillus cereus]|uniref:hypothetical protein n=1 Tax=Bacillus cereus TaxID=1396 RepID=UPI003D6469D4